MPPKGKGKKKTKKKDSGHQAEKKKTDAQQSSDAAAVTAESTRTETAEGSHVVTVATENEASAPNPIPDGVNVEKAKELAGDLWSKDFLIAFQGIKNEHGGDTIPREKFEELLTAAKTPKKNERDDWTSDKETWEIKLTSMQNAISHARSMGKTPLIVDTTEAKAVDSFFGYQSAIIIEAKKCVMDSRNTPVEDIHEELRSKLVQGMTLGSQLYFRLSTAAADFKGKFCHPEKFPVELFQTEPVEQGTYKAHPNGDKINSKVSIYSLEWIEKLAKEGKELEDAKKSFLTERGATFEVILCTHFEPSDYKEFLDYSLPMEMFQAIIVHENEWEPGQ